MRELHVKSTACDVLNEIFDQVCLPYGGISEQTSDSVSVILLVFKRLSASGKMAYSMPTHGQITYLAERFEQAGIPVRKRQDVPFIPQTARAYSNIDPVAVMAPCKEQGQDAYPITTDYADYVQGSVKLQSTTLNIANEKGTHFMLLGADAAYMRTRQNALIKALSF